MKDGKPAGVVINGETEVYGEYFICNSSPSVVWTDLFEKEEEKALCKTYTQGQLNADILKLSHHGLPTSNTEEFLAKVSPKHSFAVSTGYTDIEKASSGNKVRQTYTSRSNAAVHGFVYMVGDEKKNFGGRAYL